MTRARLPSTRSVWRWRCLRGRGPVVIAGLGRNPTTNKLFGSNWETIGTYWPLDTGYWRSWGCIYIVTITTWDICHLVGCRRVCSDRHVTFLTTWSWNRLHSAHICINFTILVQRACSHYHTLRQDVSSFLLPEKKQIRGGTCFSCCSLWVMINFIICCEKNKIRYRDLEVWNTVHAKIK